MQKKLIHSILVAVCAFAITALVVVATLKFLHSMVVKEQKLFTDTALSSVEEITNETTSTLMLLNRVPVSDCSDDMLLYMRQMVFQSHMIKDIGYIIDEHLVCTTGMGRLKTLAKVVNPDVISESGFNIWFDQPLSLFSGDYSAFATRLDRFNVVIDKTSLNYDKNTDYRWELLFADGNQQFHVSGEQGLFAALSSTKLHDELFHDDFFHINIDVTQCSDAVPFCVASTTDPLELASTEYLFGIAILVVIVYLLAYLLCLRFSDFYYSTTQRVKRGMNCTSFYPLFQPLVDLSSGKIIGCEVLARFEDGNGPLYPDEFIKVISDLDLSFSFTQKIMQSGTRNLAAEGGIPEGFKVNFNVFPRDVSTDNIQTILASGILDSRFNICFEITEDEVFNSKDKAQNIDLLRQNGIELAVDDFGTGYANLGQLQQLNFDSLKIDRSFVMALEGGSVKATLIPHVIDIAEKLNVYVVAEGIETQQQCDALRESGVKLGQGWLFGKPMTAQQLARLISAQHKA